MIIPKVFGARTLPDPYAVRMCRKGVHFAWCLGNIVGVKMKELYLTRMCSKGARFARCLGNIAGVKYQISLMKEKIVLSVI
jgi:hypothetical protein